MGTLVGKIYKFLAKHGDFISKLAARDFVGGAELKFSTGQVAHLAQKAPE